MSLLRKLQIFSSDVAKLWNIDVANTSRTTGTVVGAVQVVDQTGKVPPAGDAVGNAPFVKITDGTDTASVIMANGEMGLVTVTPGHVSTDNSYASTIASGATWTGTAEEIINHGVISVIVNTSLDSATGGFKIEFSHNGTTWLNGDTYTLYANVAKVFSFQCAAKYYRLSLTNGTGGIATVILQSVLKPYYVKPSSHRIGDVITQDDDAELVKAALTARYGTTFVPINASVSGNLQVTDAENGLAIAKGEVTDSSFIHKFGYAPDFDTTDGAVTIWDGAEDGTAWELMVYQYSATADIDSVSSSDNTDTVDVTIVGLDTNWDEVTQTVTLSGQTRVALTTSLIRVYRAYNSNTTAFAGHVVVYVNTALTAGIPTDKSKIRAIIDPVNQQTEMCVYTVPAGYTAYMRSWYTSTAGASKSSNYIIKLKSRLDGKVFRVKHISAISDIATSYLNHEYMEPEVFPEKTDIELTAQVTETGISGASISGGFDIVLVAN